MNAKKLTELSKEELIKIILMQAEQIEMLKEKIKELEKNSSNSSKPPSGDIEKQNKKNRSLRKKSEKTAGGQKGHKGYSRLQTENPDKEIKCEPTKCECCGELLENCEGEIIEKRQKRDIPEIKIEVTEYQKIEKKCKCGHKTQGKFPKGINAALQIGPNIKTLTVYLNMKQLIPYDRIKQLVKDLCGFDMSTGSIDNILEIGYVQSQKHYKKIMAKIKTSKWVGSDETGLRFEGKRGWLWTWQNKEASYYATENSRGYKVVKKHLEEDYEGVLVHDCWSAQNNTIAQKGHQLCHVHIQRDLKFLIEEYGSKWAYQMNKLLIASQKARDKIHEKNFCESRRKKIIEGYRQKLEKMNQEILHKKAEKTLQKRFQKHKEKIFFFMTDFEIPFHNNGSEQAIRPAKVKQKISGCFRSKNGADRYACLLSFIETCRKQGRNIFQSIRELLQDDFSFNFGS